MIYLDTMIFFAVWSLAQWIFRGYEAHVPYKRRLAKLTLLTLSVAMVYSIAGRLWFYALLIVMTLTLLVVHAYWFHHRHGIHWRTAEPRDDYLRLIKKSRNNSSSEQ